MADIDIAGLEWMRERMTHSAADIRPAGLVLIPAGPETFPVNWVPFYRKDLDTLLAALRARDDRIAEMEYEVQSVAQDRKEWQDELEDKETELKDLEDERDELIEKLDSAERELAYMEKELAQAQDDLRDLKAKVADATETIDRLQWELDRLYV